MPSGDDDDVVDASEDHPLTLRDDDVAGAAAGDARGRDVRGSMRSDDASSSRRRRRRRGLLRRLPRVNAWTVLAAAVVVQACAGLTYSFAVYSDALRVVFPRQLDIDLLGSFKDFGAYFGVAGGVLYDAYGPSVTLVVGALLHALGYVGVYATVTRRWPGFRARPPLWRTAGIIAVASNGNSLFDTAALCASMANFPTRKGLVSGVLKAYLGLSSAIFGQLYDAFVPERESGGARRSAAFVLMIACVGGAVGVAMSPLVRIVPTPRRRKRAAAAAAAAAATAMFRRVILALVALVAWVTLAATVNDPDLIGASIPAWVNVALTTGMLLVLLSPWALLRGVIFGAGGGGGCGRAGGKRARQEEDDELRAGLLPGGDERTSDEEEEEEEDDDDEEEEEEEDEENPAPPALLRSPPLLRGQTSSSLTLAQSARSVEFWILFATLTLSSGAATTLVNNQVRSIQKFFTHRPVSTFDRYPFQLIDELLYFCMEWLSGRRRRRLRRVGRGVLRRARVALQRVQLRRAAG